MRCRSNRFGQAWPGQAAEAEFAQGSSPRAYKASMLSADALIGSCKSHNASNATRTLAIFLPLDPHSKQGRQSIPIGHALPNGLVQPIFRPPSRRPPLACFPSVFRRDAGLKMLCIMGLVP